MSECLGPGCQTCGKPAEPVAPLFTNVREMVARALAQPKRPDEYIFDREGYESAKETW